MDAEWFKQQQRRKGLTIVDLGEAIGRDRSIVSRFYTGRQKMSFEQAEKLAEVLDVPLSEVLARAGIAERRVAQELEPGFRESDAAVWVPKADGEQDQDSLAARALGLRPGADVWVVKGKSLLLLGYAPGDRILVDGHRASHVKSGDVVIAQVYDWHSGSAKTILRQYQQPVLIAHSVDQSDWKPYVVDQDNVSIRGVVIASWRISGS
ncbi:MAG: helix-turn-helix domain-containing protein [Pseudomonadota bacterium]|nr:helix-turn-helix domain-containing protein [Pseudomonadota bacterium]